MFLFYLSWDNTMHAHTQLSFDAAYHCSARQFLNGMVCNSNLPLVQQITLKIPWNSSGWSAELSVCIINHSWNPAYTKRIKKVCTNEWNERTKVIMNKNGILKRKTRFAIVNFSSIFFFHYISFHFIFKEPSICCHPSASFIHCVQIIC